MNRDAATLISWDEVSDALADVEPVYADPFAIEGGWRQLWAGMFLMLAIGTVAGLCAIGAWTVARWIWGMA